MNRVTSVCIGACVALLLFASCSGLALENPSDESKVPMSEARGATAASAFYGFEDFGGGPNTQEWLCSSYPVSSNTAWASEGRRSLMIALRPRSGESFNYYRAAPAEMPYSDYASVVLRKSTSKASYEARIVLSGVKGGATGPQFIAYASDWKAVYYDAAGRTITMKIPKEGYQIYKLEVQVRVVTGNDILQNLFVDDFRIYKNL